MAYEAVDSLLCCSLYRLNTVASCVNMSHSASHSDHGFFHLHSNTQQRDNSIQCITSFAALYFISESFCGLHQNHIPPRRFFCVSVVRMSCWLAGFISPSLFGNSPHVWNGFSYFSPGGFPVRCYVSHYVWKSSQPKIPGIWEADIHEACLRKTPQLGSWSTGRVYDP